MGFARRKVNSLRCSSRSDSYEKVTVNPVGQTKSSSDPEWQPNINVAQRPADSRPENKTETERYADHAEGAGAFFFRCYVCDVGHGCWNARRRDSGNDPPEEQPTDRGRERHDDVIETETQIR